MKILVFGNPLIEKDSLPLKLIPELKGKFPEIEFIEKEPTENIEEFGKNLVIIDTVQNTEKVKLIEIKTEKDFEKLENNKIYSMHDFDLGMNLKLLKKLNLIEKVKIICVPMEIEKEKALNEIESIVKNLTLQS